MRVYVLVCIHLSVCLFVCFFLFIASLFFFLVLVSVSVTLAVSHATASFCQRSTLILVIGWTNPACPSFVSRFSACFYSNVIWLQVSRQSVRAAFRLISFAERHAPLKLLDRIEAQQQQQQPHKQRALRATRVLVQVQEQMNNALTALPVLALMSAPTAAAFSRAAVVFAACARAVPSEAMRAADLVRYLLLHVEDHVSYAAMSHVQQTLHSLTLLRVAPASGRVAQLVQSMVHVLCDADVLPTIALLSKGAATDSVRRQWWLLLLRVTCRRT